MNEMDNGDLRILLGDDRWSIKHAREELHEMREKYLSNIQIWCDLFKYSKYRGSGWELWVGEFGLTASIEITYGLGYKYEDGCKNVPDGDDPEERVIDEYTQLWWFPNYQVEDEIETLSLNGEVVFTRVHPIEQLDD
jgi:hypothetical protein